MPTGAAEAAFWCFISASSLSIAAEAAYVLHLSRYAIGLVTAFGVGALIASVSFELVEPAMESGTGWEVGIGLALGAAGFYLGAKIVSKVGSTDTPSGTSPTDDGEEGEADAGSGKAIVLGTILDGVPESAVMGMSLVGNGTVSLALLSGIWLSNFPEALSSTVSLRAAGMTRNRIRLMWAAIVALSILSGVVGYALVNTSPGRTGALIEAFAAGALLTMLVDEMVPAAVNESGREAGLSTVAGFALAIFLSSFG